MPAAHFAHIGDDSGRLLRLRFLIRVISSLETIASYQEVNKASIEGAGMNLGQGGHGTYMPKNVAPKAGRRLASAYTPFLATSTF